PPVTRYDDIEVIGQFAHVLMRGTKPVTTRDPAATIEFKTSQRAVSRILFLPKQVTAIPLAPPSLVESSDRPGGSTDGPSAPTCAGGLPIWSCSVRGFACHPCCHERGALLPHLFTLTLLRPKRSGGGAVCFLCHFPSGHPDRALPGASPCGV